MRTLLAFFCVAMWMLPMGANLEADDAALQPDAGDRAGTSVSDSPGRGEYPGVAHGAQAPGIVSTVPGQYALHVSRSTSIAVTFDTEMDKYSFTDTSFLVSGQLTGFHTGTLSYDSASRTATFVPALAFRAGEVIMVTLTSAVHASDGAPFAPFAWTFTAANSGGTGRFKPTVQVNTNHPWQVGVTAADFNGDGILDLASTGLSTTSPYGRVSVMLGNGAGGFSAPALYLGGSGPHALAAADFDRDGDLDLVICGSWNNAILIYINDGAAAYTLDTAFLGGAFPFVPVPVDFNGDGMPDLAVGNVAINKVSVFLNDGDGGFGPEARYEAADTAWAPVAVDFDLDGDFDLVTGGSDRVAVLENDGSGVFSLATTMLSGQSPWHCAVGDVDGDADPDLVVTSYWSDSMTILKNDSHGAFSVFSKFAQAYGYPDPGSLLVDFDGDGDLDVATVFVLAKALTLRMNNGLGVFSFEDTTSVPYYMRGAYSVDLDDDGDMDVVVPNARSSISPPVNATGLSVLYNIRSCVDSDGDQFGDPGYAENECDVDNCPDGFNPSQTDTDGDGYGDACDNCMRHATPGNVGIMTGDVNRDSLHTLADIIYLVSYVLKGGPEPQPIWQAGDVLCNGAVTLADIISMVNYVFKGGSPPCDRCEKL